MEDCDALFLDLEKLDFLRKLRDATNVSWRGRFGPPVNVLGAFRMSSAMLETEAMQRLIELLGTDVPPAGKAALGR